MRGIGLLPEKLPVAVILALASTISLVWAADRISEQSSVTEKSTTTGAPTIIQHIDSKMEPTVVQSRTSTDPATGEKEKVVEPMIMERHEKVLDTTILQPEMTETKTTTLQKVESKGIEPVKTPKPAAAKFHSARRVCHKHYIATHKSNRTYRPKAAISSTDKTIVQTTEIVRQPVIKETFIQGQPDNNPAPTPQVIQRTESTK